MIDIFILAIIAAAGIILLVFKIAPMRRVLAFDVPIDIAATVILCFAMAGTFTGIMIGLVAGTIITIVLFIMKKIIGADTWTPKGWVESPRRGRRSKKRRRREYYEVEIANEA